MSIRICGGEARGRRLQVPPGRLRPTTERIRAAVFAILASKVVDAKVLDLYAGSGAMGIEALSRGASYADLVERSAAACSVIRANVASLGYGDRARVLKAHTERFLDRSESSDANDVGGHDGGKYDLVFLDPPYGEDPWGKVLAALGRGEILSQGATAVAEHSAGTELADSYLVLNKVSSRRYGDSGISVFEASTDG